MRASGPTTWQAIRDEALRRIRDREWAPGERIPDEADLARDFGCARATVNRALRLLAEEGYLERRRKAGTRVPLTPVRKATFEIPIIRLDVEGRGQTYGYRLLRQTRATPPAITRTVLRLSPTARFLHVSALHTADGVPFCHEDRWLNPDTPGLESADLSAISANEWLVRNVTFSGGSIDFFAQRADAVLADLLQCAPGEALFAVERTTRAGALPITAVRLSYAPGYRMRTVI